MTLHREVATALERTHSESLDAVVEALAYHAWEAGDWERAATYAARAARHALALSAPREAVAHLDRAFSAAERAGLVPAIDLSLARGRANETLGEFQRAHDDFTSALERAGSAGDRRTEWEALYAFGMLWSARDYARAGDYRRDALAVSRALGDELLVARSLNRVGNWHVNLEEPRAGLPHHEEALAIFDRLRHEPGVAETIDLIGMAHHLGGTQQAAASYFERSVALLWDAANTTAPFRSRARRSRRPRRSSTSSGRRERCACSARDRWTCSRLTPHAISSRLRTASRDDWARASGSA